MQRGALGLLEVPFTAGAIQLAPGTAVGMAVGAEIAPADPAPIGTVRVRAEMQGGVHLAAAPPCGHDAGWRRAGGRWTEVASLRTGVAIRLGGEARKGHALTMALGHWGSGLECRRTRGGVAGPRPMEHDAQPYECDQRELVVKEMGDHDKIPSHRWSNEGILLGFPTVGISRRLEVQDQSVRYSSYPQPPSRACRARARYARPIAGILRTF